MFQIPYLSLERIHAEADGFLAKYWNGELPVDIEHIAESSDTSKHFTTHGADILRSEIFPQCSSKSVLQLTKQQSTFSGRDHKL